ncbi:hypothetical protein ACIG56_16390 [Nocardia fusca]|uniref:hypothetical protein n=1 Tax=Nocardia fusca TaxID=941183 RepID=UPI0037C99005
MGKEPRTRLEQLASEQGLGPGDFQRAFAGRAESLGVEVEVSRSAAKRWFQGSAGQPRPGARRVLESWFGEPIAVLFGPPHPETCTRAVTEQELALSAAHESVSHAIEAASALDPSALEHLHGAARKAATAYYTTPPLELLTDLVALRDTVYDQLDRTHKPLQQAELYLLAGQVCGLLSSVTWDLGLTEPAEEQARAAYTYGCIIEHPSLQAWARALQVTLASGASGKRSTRTGSVKPCW